MRVRRDCANLEPGGPVGIHAGPHGIRSEPLGSCRLSLMGLDGCPSDCPHHAASG